MADPVADALRAIYATNLTPYEHKILALDFVKGAFEPPLAAAEILRAVSEARAADVPVVEALLTLKREWHDLLILVASPAPVTDSLRQLLNARDHGRCCLTPAELEHTHVEPSHVISPALKSLWQGTGRPRLLDLLSAYLTPAKVETLKAALFAQPDRLLLRNVLLLSPSIGFAIRNGSIWLRPAGMLPWAELDLDASSAVYPNTFIPPDDYSCINFANGEPYVDDIHNKVRLCTDDLQHLPLPDPRLLEMQSKLSHALRNFHMEKIVQSEGVFLGESKSSDFWSRPWQLFFRRIWHFLPLFLRSKAYQYLFRQALQQDITPRCVRQLPFGLYAKVCDRSDDNEPTALKMLEKYAPGVPAPLLIDQFQDMDDVKWIIMTKMPGYPALGTVYRMSYAQRAQLAADLSYVLHQLHAIPNHTKYLISGAGGGRIYDWRCSMGYGCGPFASQAAFNNHLTQRSRSSEIYTALQKRHRSVFTHGDLFFCNVLVDNGRLSGIVDWETSGFMPEYWDFTKVMRVVQIPEEIDICRRIWGDTFEEELETEKLLWYGAPLGGPDEAESERVDLAPTFWPRVGFRAWS